MSPVAPSVFRLCHTFENPSSFLDPKVLPFKPFLALPIFRGARSERQAMTA
jgi:hypothetical protein